MDLIIFGRHQKCSRRHAWSGAVAVPLSVVCSLCILIGSSHAQSDTCLSISNVDLDAGFLEDHDVDTSLFNLALASDAPLNLTLEPQEGEPEGYMRLEDLDGVMHIVLNRTLQLNVLNPPPPRFPVTQEELSCNYTKHDDKQGTTTEIKYTLTCENNITAVPYFVRTSIQQVNQFAPEFHCPTYRKGISEASPLNTLVFTMNGLAYDRDFGGEIATYDLDDSEGDKFIILDYTTGRIGLNTPLDYDYGRQLYTLNVTAEDVPYDVQRKNWTLLEVEVLDTDDQNPVFSDDLYDLSLQEENTSLVGEAHVTTPPVYAHDLDFGINATINYEFLSGHEVDGVTYFSLDQATGYVILLQKLDREDISHFMLDIKAYQVDNPLKRTTRARILVTVEDVNDHIPEMEHAQYTFGIQENLPTGMMVANLSASDQDLDENAQFHYHLEIESGAFVINEETGEMFVGDSSLLDREAQATFVFYVYAKETLSAEQWPSDMSEINVNLADVNDNSPIFWPGDVQEVDFSPQHSPGDAVAWAFANDSDAVENGQVFYSIQHVGGCPSDWFTIEESSGEIVGNDIATDNDIICSLTVSATDQALVITTRRSTSAVILVNVDASISTTPGTGGTGGSQDSTLVSHTISGSQSSMSNTAPSQGVSNSPGGDDTSLQSRSSSSASTVSGQSVLTTVPVSQDSGTPITLPSGGTQSGTRPSDATGSPSGPGGGTDSVSGTNTGYSIGGSGGSGAPGGGTGTSAGGYTGSTSQSPGGGTGITFSSREPVSGTSSGTQTGPTSGHVSGTSTTGGSGVSSPSSSQTETQTGAPGGTGGQTGHHTSTVTSDQTDVQVPDTPTLSWWGTTNHENGNPQDCNDTNSSSGWDSDHWMLLGIVIALVLLLLMMIIILVCVLYKQTKNDEHPVSTEMGVKNEGIYMSIGDFDKISKCSENHYTSI